VTLFLKYLLFLEILIPFVVFGVTLIAYPLSPKLREFLNGIKKDEGEAYFAIYSFFVLSTLILLFISWVIF
jgi:hypothetical protein